VILITDEIFEALVAVWWIAFKIYKGEQKKITNPVNLFQDMVSMF
jgi:hypothetical protein